MTPGDAFQLKMLELAQLNHWSQITQYQVSAMQFTLAMKCPHGQYCSAMFDTFYLDEPMAIPMFQSLQSICANQHINMTVTNNTQMNYNYQVTYQQYNNTPFLPPPKLSKYDPYPDHGDPRLLLDKLRKVCPGLEERVKLPCRCGGSEEPVASVIMHLNDGDRWSHEEIGQWMKSTGIDFSFVATNEGD